MQKEEINAVGYKKGRIITCKVADNIANGSCRYTWYCPDVGGTRRENENKKVNWKRLNRKL